MSAGNHATSRGYVANLGCETRIANQREIKIPNKPIAATRIKYIPTKRRMAVMIRVLSAFDTSIGGGVDPGFLDRKRAIEAQQRSDKPTA